MKLRPEIFRPKAEAFILVLLLVVFSLPSGTSGLVLAMRVMEANGQDLVALAGALVYFAGLILLARQLGLRTGAVEDRKFLRIFIPAVFALKLVFILTHLNFSQHADCRIFLGFVERLAAAPSWPDELTKLSVEYDYYIWVSRGFPFLHGLAWLLPEQHVVWAQVLTALWQALTILLVDRILARLMPTAGIRRIGIVLLAGIPSHWWQMLDYGHHFFITTLLAAVIFVTIKMAESKKWAVVFVYSILFGLLQFLLALQVGVDMLGVVFAVVTFVLILMGQPEASDPDEGKRRKILHALIYLLVAVCIWLPAKRMYFNWQSSFDEHRLSAGTMAFMARGYNFERMGEYIGQYEQMDMATPHEEKKRAALSIVISRMGQQPLETFGLLIPAKFAKYGLLGFAGTTEQSLQEMGRSFESVLFRWFRMVQVPIYLGLMLAGVLFSVGDAERARTLVLPAFFILGACGVYCLLGETSPRYSVYAQPFIAILAGVGLVSITTADRKRAILPGLKMTAVYVPVVLVAYAGAALILWGVCRAMPVHLQLQKLEAGEQVERIKFESFAAGIDGGGHLTSSEMPIGWAGFYVWPDRERKEGDLVVWMADRVLLRVALGQINRVGYFRVYVPEPGKLRLEVTQGGRIERVGYLRAGLMD